jgi:hypothetical protein
MMHPARHILLLSVIALPWQAFSQTAGDERKVQDLLKRAERHMQAGILQFAEAEGLLNEALAITPQDGEVQLLAGVNQLNGPQRHQALPFLEEAARLGADPRRVHYLLAYARQLNAQWEEAIEAYQQHQRNYTARPEDAPMYGTAATRIKECRNGLRFSAAPSQLQVTNAGAVVNSRYADYGALPSPTGDSLWFTTRRPVGAAKVNKSTGEYFENVHLTTGQGGAWSAPQTLGPPVNSAGNDASVGLTAQGALLLYRDDKGHGDLFLSERKGDGWQVPQRLGSHVNTRHNESSAWITADGLWIYFVSDRPEDNVGGQDIYRSRWDEVAGEWGPARNLGPTVNSIDDEDGVFLTPDGNTLYFSSRGHDSMGGYDIFRSHLVDGQWGKPENLGWPVNSPDDDLFFVLSADGRTGWFSSVRPGGEGEDDVYRVEFPGQE